MADKKVVKAQKAGEGWALYLGDCCQVLPQLPSESVGFSIFSPPFCDLFTYSEDPEDMGNSRTKDEFFRHFSFLIEQLHRLLLPGRVVAVHCAELPIRKQDSGYIGQYDFPGALIRCFESFGFIFHSRHCIWKDPLVLFMRTKLAGLAHKQIVSDSSLCRTGNPDYLLAFRKKGENPVPIRHPEGLSVYHGQRKVPRELVQKYGGRNVPPNKNKMSHWIWQKYASPVWDDIRQMNVLKYRPAREKDDERHICPLQLDVIERCVELWSTKGDVVLTPFMGVGSEVYVAVKNGRKAVGVELKSSYFRQALRNLRTLEASKAKKDHGLGAFTEGGGGEGDD